MDINIYNTPKLQGWCMEEVWELTGQMIGGRKKM
jgi:hypothetical protein